MLNEGQLGIHPPGALGVAFFVHAKADCFVGRAGDGITQPLKEAGAFTLADGDALKTISLKGRIFANLLEAEAQHALPELLLVCCNPTQLSLLTGEMVRFLENLAQRGRLKDVEDVRRHVPTLLILPNGILAEQTVSTYVEQLSESRLMDRLPGVTDEMVAALIDRVVRGISLQAGGRRGSGAETVYILERKGSLVFAGGGAPARQRIERLLAARDYPAVHVADAPATRIEFDKAMISIVLNVCGLIHTIAPDGSDRDVRMGDLCKDPTKADLLHEVTGAVFRVGVAAGAYPPEAIYENVWAGHRATILKFAGHVTSSLKSFRDALEQGLDRPALMSNEEWILKPLSRYAVKHGLLEEDQLFRSLGRQVQEAMARAIKRRRSTRSGEKGRPMKLFAQRHIGIEMYESGPDDILVVGTMLDSDHLIKLEMAIHLPDEQITAGRVEMIRAPFPVCREVEDVTDQLVGLRIERGVLNEIARRVGGRVGCSHIKEIATNIVYFAASWMMRRRAGLEAVNGDFRSPEEQFRLTRDFLANSCLAYCQTTPLGLDAEIGIRRVGDVHSSPIPLSDYEPSIGLLLRDRAQRWGDKVYLRFRSSGTDFQSVQTGKSVPPAGACSLTWTEFADRVFHIARRFLALGVRPGDRIGMISENRVEMFLCELAAMSIGAVSIPVFAGYHAPQVGYILRHARPRFVIVSGWRQLEKIERERHPWVETFFCMDFGPEAEDWGAADFATLYGAWASSPCDIEIEGVNAARAGRGTGDPHALEGAWGPRPVALECDWRPRPCSGATDLASTAELDERFDAVRPDDLCLIMYTSGTTGPPKGVMLTHANLISQQKAMSLLWDVDETDVFLSYLPWHHSFGGLFERFMALYNGCELCLDDGRGRDLDRLLENWRLFNPTIFFSVPRVHDLIISCCGEDAEAAASVFGGRLRFVFTAAAPLPAKVEAAYRKHHIPVLEGWGLTETSPCVTVRTREQAWRPGYVGFPIPGVSIRIDANQEILVQGPNVMRGYLDDEEATAHVIDADGWLHTGDLGEFTPEGLRIFGRKDGAFKLTTGEMVHPQRVETLLVNESPYINSAVVVGPGRDFGGVLIFPDFGCLRRWARDRGIEEKNLTRHPEVQTLYAAEIERINPLFELRFQRPRRAVLADREPSMELGEVTPSAKIVRKRVLSAFQREIEAMYDAQPSDEVILIGEASMQQISVPSPPTPVGGTMAKAGRRA